MYNWQKKKKKISFLFFNFLKKKKKKKDYHIGLTNFAFYGSCLDTKETILSGNPISYWDANLIRKPYLCSEELSESDAKNCSEALKKLCTISIR